jgi:hypothetical protein
MAITDAQQIKNALQSWPFRLEFNGYSSIFFAKAKLPKRAFETQEYSGGGQTLAVKQAGGEKIETLSFEAIVSAAGSDRSFWDEWGALVRTRDTSKYYKDGTLTMLGPNDDPSMIWDLQDAWLKEHEYEDFDSEDKKKLVKIKGTLEMNDCKLRVR